MSRGYSATPLWGLSGNSAFFRENLSATYSALCVLVPCVEQSFAKFPSNFTTSPVSPYQKYHILVSIRKSVKGGHCTRAEQECCIMTD